MRNKILSEPSRAGRLPGDPGMWAFILGDCLMFGLFLSLFLLSRGDDPLLHNSSQDLLNSNFGFVNTIILLVSSLFVVLAMKAIQKSEKKVAFILIALAIACGLGFMLSKAMEYSIKFHSGITIISNDFFMYYFVITGLHLVHVVIGIVLLLQFLVTRKNIVIASGDVVSFETRAIFWHMVDMLWIVIFPILYLVR